MMISSEVIERPVQTAYRALSRVMHLDVTHLMLLRCSDVLPIEQPRVPAMFQFLNAGDVKRFAHQPVNELDEQLAVRVQRPNDYCLAAIVNGELAAYSWYALGSIEAEFNCGATRPTGTALSFPRHMAFMYKAFVVPKYRGHRLCANLQRRALFEFTKCGVSAILTTSDWSNGPTLRTLYNLGFQHLGNIWRVGIGEHVAGVYPSAAKLFSIQVGPEADLSSRLPIVC